MEASDVSEKQPFNVLVLGPGAFKGFYILGAVMYLSSKKIIDDIECYVGVSVGALISLTVALGLSVVETSLKALEINNLLDDIGLYDSEGNINIPRFISAILDNVGLTSSGKIREILSRIVFDKLGFSPSFESFYQATGKKLVIIASNLTKNRVDIFDKTRSPNMLVLDAVMLSMNIPGIFYKANYKGNVYVDGALGNPYPVDTQDDGKNNILGVYVETNHDPQTVIGYTLSTADFSMREIRRRIIERSSERCKHIRIESNIKDSTGVTLDFAAKAYMIASGWVEAATSFNDKIVSVAEASLSTVTPLMREIRGDDRSKIIWEAGLLTERRQEASDDESNSQYDSSVGDSASESDSEKEPYPEEIEKNK